MPTTEARRSTLGNRAEIVAADASVAIQPRRIVKPASAAGTAMLPPGAPSGSARSATVRATLRTRWKLRADNDNCVIAIWSSERAASSTWQSFHTSTGPTPGSVRPDLVEHLIDTQARFQGKDQAGLDILIEGVIEGPFSAAAREPVPR